MTQLEGGRQATSELDPVGRPAAVWVALAGVMLAFTANAWVADDAFITFRVVDNLVHGYGLRWNVDERVQVYTHPLWMLLHIPLQVLTGNPFLNTIGLSLVLTAVSLWLLLDCLPVGVPTQLVLLWLIALSGTLRDHLVNGLEAPLVAVLTLAFWRTILRSPARSGLAFVFGGLALLTRLDTGVLLALPMLRTWLSQDRAGKARCLLAFGPLGAWYAFSLFYYGFALPNTKYAKLNTGIPLESYVTQGGHYLRDFFTSYDIFSGAVLVVALGWACLRVADRTRPPLPEPTMLNAISVLAYLAYVMLVGGDFMGGRFLVLPIVMSLLLLAQLAPALGTTRAELAALAAVGVAGLQHWQYQPRDVNAIIAHYGIADERSFYVEQNTLFPPGGGFRTEVTGTWRDQGEAAGRRGGVVAFNFTGVYGYYAGPGTVIIDANALSDPLLARLPIPDVTTWRIGHFTRQIPDGYLAARAGDESAMPPDLRAYYDRLRLVTSGQLMDRRRLETLLGFQFGRYDRFRDRYLDTP